MSETSHWKWVSDLTVFSPPAPLQEIAYLRGSLAVLLERADVRPTEGVDDMGPYVAIGLVRNGVFLMFAARRPYADKQIDVFGDPSARETAVRLMRDVFEHYRLEVIELPRQA
jgi:hypothetical protein